MSKNLLVAGARQKAHGKHVKSRLTWVPRRDERSAAPKKDDPLKPTPSGRIEDSTKFKNWAAVHGRNAASVLDFIIQDYLTSQKNMKENSDFITNWPGLGKRVKPNYYLPKLGQVWFISGSQYVQPISRTAAGLTQMVVAAKGLKPLTLKESDILAKTKLTLDKALQGRG